MNHQTTPLKLIVNADDFGPNESVSKAILDAFEEGIVTSTSVIVNIGGAEPWIHELASRELPAGIHLNIFSGRPVSNPQNLQSLVDNEGNFRRFASISEMETQINTEELLNEFRAQTHKLISSGVSPTHIDIHRHEIYFCQNLFAVIIDLAKEMALPIRMPLECSIARYGEKLALLANWNVQKLVSLQSNLRALCDSNEIRRPKSFIPDLMLTTKLSCSELLESISSSPPGVAEICSHPSHTTERGLHDLRVLRELHTARKNGKVHFDSASFKNV